jgi:hypothetical protein
MKITLLFLLWVAQQAFADLPNFDPAVAKLRDEFATSRTPTASELLLGQEWSCTYLNAMRGQNKVYLVPNAMKFREVDGLIFNDSGYQVQVKTLALTGQGLSGLYVDSNYRCLETYRAKVANQLIVEWACNPADLAGNQQVESLSDPSYFVGNYGICMPM